jgi:hypothetical protein
MCFRNSVLYIKETPDNDYLDKKEIKFRLVLEDLDSAISISSLLHPDLSEPTELHKLEYCL